MHKVNGAKRFKENQTVRYRRLKRYDILNIDEEKFAAPLSALKIKTSVTCYFRRHIRNSYNC